MIEFKKGNIFTTECDVIVNTVNCSGVMGAGIAYEFRLRYPEMFHKYKELCEKRLLTIGKLWIYTLSEDDIFKEKYRRVLNFPTKNFWKLPSKEEYLEKGLEKFVETYKEKNITSIAFPLLGASKGGIAEETSIRIMEKYLSQLDIKVEIWHFDPKAVDDVYEDFKERFNNISDNVLKEESGLGLQYIKRIRTALESDDIRTMNGLSNVKGIGEVTLEKSFRFIRSRKELPNNLELF
ncbi:Appr-1-p processing protein [[Haemophilus] felis]|nr:Appr-1-p processing protein [[Haemophilus] felis]